jgi:hypothetical protein
MCLELVTHQRLTASVTVEEFVASEKINNRFRLSSVLY